MKMIQPVTLNMTVIAAHVHNCLVVLLEYLKLYSQIIIQEIIILL